MEGGKHDTAKGYSEAAVERWENFTLRTRISCGLKRGCPRIQVRGGATQFTKYFIKKE